MVESANGTVASSLKEWLEASQADVVLAQELHLLGDDLAELADWARKKGWKCILEAGLPGDKASTDVRSVVAGVGIFVRDHLSLQVCRVSEGQGDKEASTVVPGRCVCGLLTLPDGGRIMLYSCYWHSGKGLARDNLALYKALLNHIGDQPFQYISGGDFQVNPLLVKEHTTVQKDAGGVIIDTDPDIGTCTSKKGVAAATLDWFLVEEKLAAGVEDREVELGSGLKPHRPVRLRFRKQLGTLALVVERPAKLATEAIVGPRPKPPDYEAAMAAASKADYHARYSAWERADAAIAQAYGAWAEAAEVEVADAVGAPHPARGGGGRCKRACRPRLVWARIQTPTRDLPADHGTDAKAARWVVNRAKEVVGACFGLRAEASEGKLKALRKAWHVLDGVKCPYVEVSEQAKALRGRLRSGLRRIAHPGGGGSCEADAEAVEADEELEEARSFVSEAEDEVARLEAEALKAKKGSWKDWVSKNLEKGASKAHKFSKIPEEWRPASVVRNGPVILADPISVVERETGKLRDIWGATDEAAPLNCEERMALEPFVPDQVREISRSMKQSGAVSADGFHMRHYSLLSDESLEVFCRILLACELVGALPRQVRYILYMLIAKPGGGLRPIGLFCSSYRMWGRLRQPHAAEWEARQERGYLAASKGRTPTDRCGGRT